MKKSMKRKQKTHKKIEEILFEKFMKKFTKIKQERLRNDDEIRFFGISLVVS